MPYQRGVFLDYELFQADFGRALLFQFLFSFFHPVFHELTEHFDLFICRCHDDMVKRVQTFLAAGDIDAFLAADDSYHAYPAGLAEIQFF